MDMTHTGQQLIFYFEVYVEFFLGIFRCLSHVLELLLFHVFIDVICMIRILFIDVYKTSFLFCLFLLFRFMYICIHIDVYIFVYY